METATATVSPARAFIGVSEVWVPEGDRLVHAAGEYGALRAFEEASIRTSFGYGEGLPGKAWAEARPVVLKGFDGSYFKRTEAAKEAGLTSAVALPVFAGEVLKAVLVVLCGDDDTTIGAIEVWAERDGLLLLDDGYYGAAKHFEWVSQHTHFPKGQGLPGGVWAAQTPMLFRDLGSGYRFIRSESAGAAGLTTGLGLPVPVPGEQTYIATLLSARGTPIARRFEIWDAREARMGKDGGAMLIDGICEREGPLWSEDNPRRAQIWQGPIGQVLGSGLPQVISGGQIAAGYSSMVALPIHRGEEIAHIVAWYV
ncbi:GAF domain-containing protein [Rhodobacter aestuarii]|uniref:GAF domain-containing protein n=1 Tax=Rhodobacter aestuarii TaxID=453582 RepID=A0A1N7PW59_9RHOB|nr:GAF domain-containing protein [Rhodobacter aestuarii]PTV94117.1 GAF domain-containing protein [Rhodobacter aestuarii]SIT14854.1 GAF domain-containing protein [Rhodobacter aestuarii]